MNLHQIVRRAITRVKPDEAFTVYRSVGQQNSGGIMTACYRRVDGFTGQWQSEGDAALYHAELGSQSTIQRKLYLYAPDDAATRPWSVYRKESRGGDLILDSRGDWWMVAAVLEDYSAVGWECLRVTLQQTPPRVTLVDESEEGGDGDQGA